MSIVIEEIELNIDGQAVIVERLDDGTFRKPDYLAGAEREVVGMKRAGISDSPFGSPPEEDKHIPVTAPATPAAQQWQGWGTALKPAFEPIIVARRPLCGTVAENVQRFGTGAINVDACRIEGVKGVPASPRRNAHGGDSGGVYGEYQSPPTDTAGWNTNAGRWPANLIHDGSAEVLAGFPMTSSGGRRGGEIRSDRNISSWFGASDELIHGTVGDTGSAARFFYCAKASKQDRDEGLDSLYEKTAGERTGRIDGSDGITAYAGATGAARNHHPTVKPTALMRYLCRLVTPPQGVILDPFMGSGSTGKAAILEGFNFVGIDTEQEYIEIAARRIEFACGKMGIVVDQPMLIDTRREMADKPKQMILL